MHVAWIAAGNDPARFWVLTFREIDREMRAAVKRREREGDERVWLAWHIVALDRTKKLPKLETLLSSGRRSSTPQTPEEHELALKAIFLAFGGDPNDLRTLQ
jgi:hypothetical protein